MSRKMLINARTPEEVRIAIVDDSKLENYQVEVAERGLTRGNIYRGTIVNIQPGLNAAFIDYGAERHGFLAIQDVVPEAYYREPKGKGRPRIDEVLERGKPIIVQVTKEPEGSKGAALTTNLSLAGRYLVLTPFDDTCGVSRKVEDDAERKRLKERAPASIGPKAAASSFAPTPPNRTRRRFAATSMLCSDSGSASEPKRGAASPTPSSTATRT